MADPLAGDLTEDESRLLQDLPRPPPLDALATTGVWIVEWRGGSERRTGTELHRWLDSGDKGWSRLVACRGRNDVVSAIKAAAWSMRSAGARPILHLDARCTGDGLEGPGPQGGEGIAWAELAPHLGGLNAASRCHLVLVCAAAGEAASERLVAAAGTRIPCVAVVAPAGVAAPPPEHWLDGMQVMYRRWRSGRSGLEEASGAMAPARVEATSMPALAYARLVRLLVRGTRPDQRAAGGPAAIVAALRGIAPDQVPPADARWQALPRQVQRLWRSLFLIDRYPDNRRRFDFDAKAAVWRILQARGLA